MASLLTLALASLATRSAPAVAGGSQEPSITRFVISDRGTRSVSFTGSQTVNVDLAATDDTRVAGYFLGETTTPPVPQSSDWMKARRHSFRILSAGGVHTVHAWAIDASGNISKPAVARFFLDSIKPNPSVDYPRTQQILKSLTRIGGDVNDAAPSSGIARAEYAILHRADCSWWNPAKHAFEKGRCADDHWLKFPVALAAKVFAASTGTLDIPGTYALSVRLTDRAGNVGIVWRQFKIAR